jgi:hypothetical protein
MSAGACVLCLNTEPKHSQHYDCPTILVMKNKVHHEWLVNILMNFIYTSAINHVITKVMEQ